MQLQIKVFSSVSAMQDSKRCFERMIDVNENVSIPFSSLLRDFKFLYGDSCVVSFNIL